MANGDSSQPIDPNANTPAASVAAAPADASAPPAMPAQSVPSTVPTTSNVDAVLAQQKPFIDNANQANARLTQLNQPDAPSAPTRHARLMNMIQGLAQGLGEGLSAAGTSIGTHGAEGGAPQVAQVQGELQRQQLAAKQAAMEAKNQELSHLQTTIDTNMKMANMVSLQGTLKDDMTIKDAQAAQAKQNLEAGQLAMTTGEAEFADKYGAPPKVWNAIANGNTDGVTPQNIADFKAFNQQKIQAYAATMPNDPEVQQALKVANDPKSSPTDLLRENATITRKFNLNQQTAKATQEQGQARETQLATEPPAPGQVNNFITNTLKSYSHIPAGERSGYEQEARGARTVGELNAVTGKALASEQAYIVHQDSINATAALAGNKFAEAGVAANEKLLTDPHSGYLPALQQVNQTLASIQGGADGNALMTNLVPTMEVLGINHAAGISRISPEEAKRAGVSPDWATQWNAWATAAATGTLSDTLARQGQQLMQVVRDAAYQKYLQSAQVTAKGHKIDFSDVPAVDKDGNSTTLDKAIALAHAPAGATHTAMGRDDKKLHYTNAQGKDLGVVPGQGN